MTKRAYTKGANSRIDGEQNPEYYRTYYERNRETILEKNKQNRQKRKEAGIKNRVTPQTWRFMVISLLQQRDGNLCAICGKELNFTEFNTIHIDHKRPYCHSKDDSAENLQLAHAVCNIRRSRKDVFQ